MNLPAHQRAESVPSSVQPSPPKSVGVSVSFNWKRRGAAVPLALPTHLNAAARLAKTEFFWPLHATSRAGLYRITITDVDHRWIYIGESEHIQSRLRNYQRLYPSKPDSTSLRLTVLIRKALIKEQSVYLDTTSTGKLIIGGSGRPLAMNQEAERRFAEAAAVLQEEELAGEDVWVLNKILDGSGRVMVTSEWDLPEELRRP